MRGRGVIRDTGELHPSAVRTDQTIDHFDKGRLSRTVLTQQRMDFAGSDGKRDTVVGHDPGIGFCQSIDSQKRVSHSTAPYPNGLRPPCMNRAAAPMAIA